MDAPVATPLRLTAAVLAVVMAGLVVFGCVSHAPQRSVRLTVRVNGPANDKRLSVRARPNRRLLEGQHSR